MSRTPTPFDGTAGEVEESTSPILKLHTFYKIIIRIHISLSDNGLHE